MPNNIIAGEADLVINHMDGGYGNAKYLAPSFAHENLVNIVHFRQRQKIWLPQQATNTGGPNRTYVEPSQNERINNS